MIEKVINRLEWKGWRGDRILFIRTVYSCLNSSEFKYRHYVIPTDYNCEPALYDVGSTYLNDDENFYCKTLRPYVVTKENFDLMANGLVYFAFVDLVELVDWVYLSSINKILFKLSWQSYSQKDVAYTYYCITIPDNAVIKNILFPLLNETLKEVTDALLIGNVKNNLVEIDSLVEIDKDTYEQFYKTKIGENENEI
jgi:hypothetical protein